MEVYQVSKGSTRTSKVKWRYVIYTGKDWEVQMRENGLSMGWNRCSWNRM